MNYYKNLNVLVTGSSGFIGKVLVKELKNLGSNVKEVDLDLGIDITNMEDLKSIKNIDLVFHLAAKTFIPDSWKDPVSTYKINSLGTLNILEFCRNNKAKLVFSSTYVYGKPKYLPIDEKHPISSTSPYTESKIIAERLCKFYKRNFDLDVKILRPFNIYGLGQNPNFLLPKIIEQAFAGSIVLENSKPKRDFVHLEDIIQAYVKAGSINTNNESIIFNIGSGKSFSVNQVVNKIVKIIGKDVEIKYTGNIRKGEIEETIADIKLANNILNWTPRIDLDLGLRKYIDNYRK